MAHQHNIGASHPGSKLKGGPPGDMYTEGIKKLRQMAKDQNLGRFHWPKAGGLHCQEGNDQDSNTEDDRDSCEDNLPKD